MSIFQKLFGHKRTIQSPTFQKDFSRENAQLEALENLLSKVVDGEKRDHIERDIRFLKYGIEGENNVYFELKHSFLPIVCLHDIRIPYEGGSFAQLDFVVISNKFICILETKKLSGNISIDREGNFIRIMKTKFGKEFKEGIYSPVTQNRRHVDILKHVISNELKIKNLPILSLVVMANPKTIISKYNCPEDIQKTLIKYDQIRNALEEFQNDKTNSCDLIEKDMLDISELLLQLHTPMDFDFEAKYQLSDEEYHRKDEDQLQEELKSFRLSTSRAEGIKAYFIFNNKEMEDLIAKYPRTEEELLTVKGFGQTKVEKYGQEILDIFNSK